MSTDLHARFRAGDESVYRILVETHSGTLLRIIRRSISDPQAANDLLQESWLRAYDRRRSFRGTGSLLGWLCALTRNVCSSSRRRREATRTPLALADEPTDPSTEREPGTDGEERERHDSIDTALERLTERQRDVGLLRVVEGLSTSETALELGCAEGTVKATLKHALAKLEPLLRGWKHA